MASRRTGLVLAVGLVAGLLPALPALAADQVTLASKSYEGVPGNEHSFGPRLSGDAAIGVFWSRASNLVPGDANGYADVFLADREHGPVGSMFRVSVPDGGGEANEASFNPDVSYDGQTVVFYSRASNLVAGDTNGKEDIFVRYYVNDYTLGTTTRVNVSSTGAQATGRSYAPAVSDDGSTVVYRSLAKNLVPGDTTGYSDIFVRDLAAATTSRVSVSTLGTPGNGHSLDPGISDDGTEVVYWSHANNLAPGDGNGAGDVFLRDRTTGTTTLVSATPGGVAGNGVSQFPQISGDGAVIVFESAANDLVPGDTNGVRDVFRYEVATGAMTIISRATDGTLANNSSMKPALDQDGSHIAFETTATNLGDDHNGKKDIYLHEIATGTTTRASLAANGTEPLGNSEQPTLNDEGRWLAFRSLGENLVPVDGNAKGDVFIRNLAPDPPPPAPLELNQRSDVTWQTDDRVLDIELSPDGATAFLAGYFTTLRPADGKPGTPLVRNHVAAIDVATGVPLPFDPNVNGDVEDIELVGTTLYMGGNFTAVGGLLRKNIAAVDTATAVATPWSPSAYGTVRAIAVTSDASRIFIGGHFTQVNSSERRHVAALDALTGNVIGGWNAPVVQVQGETCPPRCFETVGTVVLSPNEARLYIGGSFAEVGGQPHNSVAAVDAATGDVLPWNPSVYAYNARNIVYEIAVLDDYVYICGDFWSINGRKTPNFGAVHAGNGQPVYSFVASTDGGVDACAVSDRKVYIGGHFDYAGGEQAKYTGLPRQHIAAVDAVTGALDPWNPSANSIYGVFAIAVSDSKVVIGGAFTRTGQRKQEGYAQYSGIP